MATFRENLYLFTHRILYRSLQGNWSQIGTKKMIEYRKICLTALWILFVQSSTTDVQVDSISHRYTESVYQSLISTQAGDGGDLDVVSAIRSNKHAVPHHPVTSMTTCGKGLYWETEGCVNCPAGTYNPLTGAQNVYDCTACAAGTYSTSTGAKTSSVCTACAANTYSASAGATSPSSCVSCKVLTASSAGATSCSSFLGNIELFAGRHYPGTSGDGGPATTANIGELWDVVLDVARGQVFILDFSVDRLDSLYFNKIR
jgi:hypothetical protein